MRSVGGPMRLLTVHALLAVFFVSSSGSAGPKSAAEQPGISRSGSEFLEECSSIDSEWNSSLSASTTMLPVWAGLKASQMDSLHMRSC